jgi:signal transduction histidine kinase/HAMP domain-containing protein
MTLRLGAKVLATMAIALGLSSLVFLGLFLALYQKQLLNERQEVSGKLGNMLQITLENAMLKRDLEGLREIVSRLGAVTNVMQVLVLAPNGEVRFSSDPAALGRHFDPSALCEGCGVGKDKPMASTNFVRDDHGIEVLRAVNAVANREPCQVCHGLMDDHPVNGYLMLDYRADSIRKQARSLAAAQAVAGFLVIAGALAVTWFVLRRFVLAPVRLFASVSKDLSRGNFDARDKLAPVIDRGSDEIAELGRSVHQMAERLDDTISELREHQAFQQSVIDGVHDGIRVLAPDFSVVAANKAFCAQIGLSLKEVLAHPCYYSSHDRVEPCVPTLVICPLQALRSSDTPVKCTHVHTRRGDKVAIATEVVAAPVMIETRAGVSRLVVESIRDLSQNMQISQEQRLSEIGELAAGIAHEIHNPLASIRLGIRAIRRAIASGGEHETELSEYLSVADTEIDSCITVTGRIMRLSRLPTEHGVLIDIGEVAGDIAALLRYEAELAHVKIKIDVAPGLRVIAGEGELAMILLNLVQNALHAMPPGGGNVDIIGRRTGDGNIEIAVSDTGTGIKAEHIASIFLPFWSSRKDGTTGSGLGLAICNALVAKREGKITVESREGRGATFHLLFPDPDDDALTEVKTAVHQ